MTELFLSFAVVLLAAAIRDAGVRIADAIRGDIYAEDLAKALKWRAPSRSEIEEAGRRAMESLAPQMQKEREAFFAEVNARIAAERSKEPQQ